MSRRPYLNYGTQGHVLLVTVGYPAAEGRLTALVSVHRGTRSLFPYSRWLTVPLSRIPA